VPAFADSVYRSFDTWKQVLAAQPAHFATLNPKGPAVILGRLVAEGATPLVLSTNWDAYAELGCWLAGVDVARAGSEPDASNGTTLSRLLVYDRGEDAALYARHRGHAHLLKLHGGVDGVAMTLRRAADERLRLADIDAALRRSFFVSTSDLTHWRDSSQWVQDATSDALRSHRTVFVGVSGADPVTYRATRARLAEWEHYNAEGSRSEKFRCTIRKSDELDCPPLAAIDFKPTPRLYGMMAATRVRGVDYPVVEADAGRALRGAYAWWITSHLLESLDPGFERHRYIRDKLRIRLKREVARRVGSTPLIDLLCDALGPGARWAAISESRPPLADRVCRPEHRWRYAPWFAPVARFPIATRENLSCVAACVVALTHTDIDGLTDEWSGTVHVPSQHPVGSPLAGSDVLLLPWPWPAQSGLASEALHTAIADRIVWNTGRSRFHLGSPQLHVVPVGIVGDGPAEIVVAGAPTRVTRVDWFEQALKGAS
jgi:hypothetical protein